VIFNNNDLPQYEPKYTPWDVKEATLKNFLGVFGCVGLNYLFNLSTGLYSVGVMGFGLNWIYQLYSLMGHAIVKIELHKDGKNVTVTYKTGGS
jgi:hypothetical protein